MLRHCITFFLTFVFYFLRSLFFAFASTSCDLSLFGFASCFSLFVSFVLICLHALLAFQLFLSVLFLRLYLLLWDLFSIQGIFDFCDFC